MSVDSSFSFDIYPDVDAELAAAYRRNVAGGTASPEEVAIAGLDAVVTEAIAGQSSLEQANLPLTFREQVEAACEATDRIMPINSKPAFEGIGLESIDWGKLSSAYAEMLGAGLKPEVIVARQGQSSDYWRGIYSNLPNTKKGGLYINSDVENYWTELTISETNVNPEWSVLVMPSADEPPITDVPHNMTMSSLSADKHVVDALQLDQASIIADTHPDISSYLTLQALRLQDGKEPVDGSTYTWLKGTFDNDSKAPYGYWDSGVGQVYVYWYETGDQLDYLGVRPAVRGAKP